MRKQFSIQMDEEMRRRLDKVAQRKCMGRSEYIRWLIDKGLDLAYDAGFCDGLEAQQVRPTELAVKLRKELENYGTRKSTYA